MAIKIMRVLSIKLESSFLIPSMILKSGKEQQKRQIRLFPLQDLLFFHKILRGIFQNKNGMVFPSHYSIRKKKLQVNPRARRGTS